MAKYIPAGLLFLLPLLVLPFGVSPFEIPKIIGVEIFIEILLLFVLLKNNLSLKKFNQTQLIVTGILFLLSLLHLVFLKTPDSFFGNPFRMQGIFLLWHLLIFSLISQNIKLSQNSSFLAFFSLLVLSLSALILGGDINGRTFGTLGEANSLAAASLFLWPFLIFSKSRIFKITGTIFLCWIILSSGSRSGAIAFAIQIVFLSLIYINKFSLFKVLFFCLGLTALSLSLVFVAGGGWYGNRAEVWQTALVAGSFSPIFGSGFGNIQPTLHKASLMLNNNIQYQVVDSSHNFLLDFWVQGGFLGISGLILLLWDTVRGLIKNQRRLELTAFLGIFTVMLFNPVSVVILVYFWWLIGRGFSGKKLG